MAPRQTLIRKPKPTVAQYRAMWAELHYNAEAHLPLEYQHNRFMGIVSGLRERCNCFDHAFYIYYVLLDYAEGNLSILKQARFLMRFLHNEVNFKLNKEIFVLQKNDR